MDEKASKVSKSGLMFSGLFNEDILDFIEKSMCYFREKNIHYEDRLSELRSMLSGNALEYYNKVISFCIDIEDVNSFLRKRYTGHLYELQVIREFFHDIQGLKETATDFIERKMQLFNRLPSAHENTDIVELLRGQFRPANPQWALNPNIKNITDLVVAANKLEIQKPYPKPRSDCKCVAVNDINCPLNVKTEPIPKTPGKATGAIPKTPKPKIVQTIRKKFLENIQEAPANETTKFENIILPGKSTKKLTMYQRFSQIPKCPDCEERHFSDDECPASIKPAI